MVETELIAKEKEQDFGYVFNLVNSGVPIDKAIDAEEKFRDGRYEHPNFCFEAEVFHRIHTSVTEPALFAYFPEPTSEKAVKIRKGKYYQKFFPKLLPEDVSDIVCTDNDVYGKVQIVTSEEDIIDAYVNLGDDFSCMRHEDAWNYEDIPGLEEEIHPVAFYGRCKNAKIGIAKIYDSKKNYFARALVNLDTMKHSRVYDKTGSGTVEDILIDSGFTSSNSVLTGCEFEAKNKKEDENGCINQICPYIDGHPHHAIGFFKEKRILVVDEYEKLKRVTQHIAGTQPCCGHIYFDFSKYCKCCGNRIKSDGPDVCKSCEVVACKKCGKNIGHVLRKHLGFCPTCKANETGTTIFTTLSGNNITVDISIDSSGVVQFRIVSECDLLRSRHGEISSFYSTELDRDIGIHSQCNPQITYGFLYLYGYDSFGEKGWKPADNNVDVLIEAVNHLNSLNLEQLFGPF